MLLTTFKFSFSLLFLPNLLKLYINYKITLFPTVYLHYTYQLRVVMNGFFIFLNKLLVYPQNTHFI
jgi:hypothetical protein